MSIVKFLKPENKITSRVSQVSGFNGAHVLGNGQDAYAVTDEKLLSGDEVMIIDDGKGNRLVVGAKKK